MIPSREQEVLTLLARGNTAAEVATRLNMSEAGVRAAAARARDRMGARNTTHAVALAVALGMLDVDHGQGARLRRARALMAEAARLMGNA